MDYNEEDEDMEEGKIVLNVEFSVTIGNLFLHGMSNKWLQIQNICSR